MREGIIVLGDVIFEDAEILDAIAFEAAETVATQHAVGQLKQAAASKLGIPKLKWHGRFIGPRAPSRALEIRSLAQSQARTPLTWHGSVLEVVVALFESDCDQPDQVPYRVECLLLSKSLPMLEHSAAQHGAAHVCRVETALRSLARSLGRQSASTLRPSPPFSSPKDQP